MTGIDFALDPGGVLSGVVVAAATQGPVPSASVSLNPEHETLNTKPGTLNLELCKLNSNLQTKL